MGFWVAGRCLSTQADADLASWSNVPPALVSDPPGVVVVQVGTGGWEYAHYSQGSLVASYAVPSVGFAECEVGASAVEGAELGFLVGGVWVVVWGVLMLARALK